MEAQRKAGFKAVKLGWGPLGQSAELDVALVAAARKAGGDDLDLMIDVGKGWQSARDGIDRARRMEEYNPFWIEEPFWPDDYAKYAALVAAVQHAHRRRRGGDDARRFRAAGRRGPCRDRPARRDPGRRHRRMPAVADYARRQGRRCVLHAWSTGIIKAATLQVLAAMEEAEYMEYCVQTTDLNQRLVAERFPLVDGYVAIPTGPGLGIELDEAVLKEFAVR